MNPVILKLIGMALVGVGGAVFARGVKDHRDGGKSDILPKPAPAADTGPGTQPETVRREPENADSHDPGRGADPGDLGAVDQAGADRGAESGPEQPPAADVTDVDTTED